MLWVMLALSAGVSLGVMVVVVRFFTQVNSRLAQMNVSLQEAYKAMGQNLGNATLTFGSVKEQLGRLEETNRQIYEVSKDIASLQELLRAPKLRGQLGELFLDNLLSQVLPKQHYQMQYRFKSGEAVDAVIRLGERLVPVDAKFSLENFQKMNEAQDEQAKAAGRRKFIQDIKNRVDEIASKYILPQENTYDFALMYVPAENIYYEIIIKEDLLPYFFAKKVVPVSPNTFYAYLKVICLGLRGLQIEENAKQILKNLSGLTVELDKFREDFDLLGRHLHSADSKFQDGQKRLDKFTDKLTNIQDARQLPEKEGAGELR
ncbi:MAG: DNA recombination protein RmuC [Candidatus Omnitrophota bacterium]